MIRRVTPLLCLILSSTISLAADTPATLKGTWVREMVVGQQIANQIALTFTDKRVTMKMTSGGRMEDGLEGWVTLEFEGEYAITDSGLCVGVVTGINADLSKIPEMDSSNDPLGMFLHKVIGEPFCFRARVVDGAMMVTDVKVPHFDPSGATNGPSGREMVMAFASGQYKSSPTDKMPLPKLKGPKATELGVIDVLGQLFNHGTARTANVPVVKPANLAGQSFPVPVNFNQQFPTPPPPLPSHLVYPQPVPVQNFVPPEYPVQPPVCVQPQPCPAEGVGYPAKVNQAQVEKPRAWFETSGPWFESPVVIPASAIRIEGVNMDDTLSGTWVHETFFPEFGLAWQKILTFKDDRLIARCIDMKDNLKTGECEFECSYVRSADGYILGRVISVDLDSKYHPMDAAINPNKPKGISSVVGEPFCFKCKLRDGQLRITDLRIPTPEGVDNQAMRSTIGFLSAEKYRKANSENVPLPKANLLNSGNRQPAQQQNPNMIPANHTTIIPSANLLAPPGSMKNSTMMPSMKEAWDRSITPLAPPPPQTLLPIPPSK